MALGGGEVVLELVVDAHGTVTRVIPLRTTPPYDDVLVKAATSWTFEPASDTIDGVRRVVPGRVLVAAVFRPPSLYAGSSAGPQPQVREPSSLSLPQPASLSIPAYPASAVGDGVVLIEIEMTRRADVRGYRVVSPGSGFDGAALQAVRTWRFAPPRAPAAADRVFVYAVFGFRAPVTQLPLMP
jgi:TonB family protein